MLKPFHGVRANLRIPFKDVRPLRIVIPETEESSDGAFVRTLGKRDRIAFPKCQFSKNGG
jgi:hypothetical protein